MSDSVFATVGHTTLASRIHVYHLVWRFLALWFHPLVDNHICWTHPASHPSASVVSDQTRHLVASDYSSLTHSRLSPCLTLSHSLVPSLDGQPYRLNPSSLSPFGLCGFWPPFCSLFLRNATKIIKRNWQIQKLILVTDKRWVYLDWMLEMS